MKTYIFRLGAVCREWITANNTLINNRKINEVKSFPSHTGLQHSSKKVKYRSAILNLRALDMEQIVVFWQSARR